MRKYWKRIVSLVLAVCLLFGGEAFSGADGLFGVFRRGGFVANAADDGEESGMTLWDWENWSQPRQQEEGENYDYYEYPLYNFAQRGDSTVFYRMKVTTIRMKKTTGDDTDPHRDLASCVTKYGSGNNRPVGPENYYPPEAYVPDKTIEVVDNKDPSFNGEYTLYSEFTPDATNPGRYYRLVPVMENGHERVQFFGNKLGGSGGWVTPHNWPSTEPTEKRSFHRDYVIWLITTGNQTVYNFLKVGKDYYRLNKQENGVCGALANLADKETDLDAENWPRLIEPYDFSGLSVTIGEKTYYYFDSAMFEAGEEIPDNYFTVDPEDYELGVYKRFTAEGNYGDENYWLGTDRPDDWGDNQSTDYRYHRDFVAVLHSSTDKYKATFKNGDEVLFEKKIPVGTAPVYEGETPTKDEDGSYVYTFAGWKAEDGTIYAPGAELPEGLTDVTYTAVFDARTKITVTATNAGKTYGDADPGLKWEVDKELPQEDLDALVVNVSRDAGERVGKYTITASGEEDQGKYHISYETGEFSVSEKPLTITANSKTKMYDATPLYDEGFETSGLAFKDKIDTISVTGSRTDVGEANNVVKDAVITDAIGEDVTFCYDISYVNGLLTVTGASNLTVSLEGSEYTYDGTAKAITNQPISNAAGGTTSYSFSFAEDGTYVSDLSTLTKTDAGTYTVYVRATNPNYSNTATTTATLKIAQKEVTVTANDKNKQYGDTDPEFDATVEGLADGEDASKIRYVVSCEHEEQTGVYTIEVTAETDQGNYLVKVENGAFIIGTYNGVIVKIVGGTKTTVYDGTEQTVEGFTVTMESGLYTFNDFKFTGYAAATAKDAGKTDMGLSADQFVNKNPNFSEVAFIVTDGWLLIDPAEAKVTAKDTKKVYGDKDPELTAETTGVFGDDKLTYEITRETGENIGAYGISVGGDEVQGNYVVSYEGGEFTIERREITVKADDIVKTYGKGDPDLTVTIENMPGEYTVSLDEMLKAAFVGAPIVNMSVRLPGTLRPFGRSAKSTNYKASAGSDVIRFTVSREEGENVGTYKITVTGEEIQGNYKVAFAEGTFEVVMASDLELTNLTPKSVVYDGKEHPLEVEASVTAGTKIEYSTDGGTTWSANAPALTNAGTVKVKVRATNPNLGDADLDVEFTIEPKAATVRVKDASKKAGEADPAWETETEGLVGSDKLTFTVARAAGETAGEYAIKASGEATQGNYTVTFVDGKLTITNAGGDVPSPKTADTLPIALLAALLLAAFTTAALAAKKRRESAE